MRRPVIAFALAAAACGAKSKDARTTESPGDESSPLMKQAVVSFGTEAGAERTKLWLVVTDETSAAKSFPLDDLPKNATCTAKPGGEMEALGTLECGGAGTVIVVARHGEFIVLRQQPDVTGEIGGFEESSHVAIPEGAKVSFQP